MSRLGSIAFCTVLLGFAAGAAAADLDMKAVDKQRAQFVDRMTREHGFSRRELDAVLKSAKIDERVLAAMSRPAERVMPWYQYRALFLTPQRITKGVEFWRLHADTVQAVAARYAVSPQMLVAILGVETFFGERTGNYRVIDSLSTLAFAYPPRAAFFASELEAFLLLTREEAVDPLQALGSYAGAMGAGQFIPSSYRAYAVDGDGDGRRDLWQNWDDVVSSVANYFKQHGWRAGEPVVERATLATSWSGPVPDNALELNDTVASLSRRGYVFPTELPQATPAAIFELEGQGEPEYWVGYQNFRVITRYNRSAMYALAAYQLGEAILAEFQAPVDGRG
jgi:peptidoglycan lytic transglycosylase B